MPEPLLTPFSGLSVSHSTEHHLVNASFHSGVLDPEAAGQAGRVGNPYAECHRYDARPPIFSLAQGAVHVHLTTVSTEQIAYEDLETARGLAEAATAYAEEIDRLYYDQLRLPGEPEQPTS